MCQGPNVVNWKDSAISGDATMSFSIGRNMIVERGAITRATTDINGVVSFSTGDLIAVALKRGSNAEVVKLYQVKSDGSLEYAGGDNDPFVWKSTSETVTLRAWSYGTNATLAYMLTAPESRDYTLETDQNTNGYRELLYCKAANRTYSTTPMTLAFYHQLTRLVINVDQELTTGTLPVTSVCVGNSAFPLVASFAVPTGDSNVGTWTTDGATYGTLTPKTEATQSGYQYTYSAVIFPGTYAKNSKMFTLTNSDGNYSYTISDDAGQSLTAGNQYNYALNVKNKLIFKNPLWWVAQYNLAQNKTSFVTEHSPSPPAGAMVLRPWI